MMKIDSSVPCSRKNYTRGRNGKNVQYIFIHYTGSQASARNNILYFSGSYAGASAHYFLDGSGTIYQSVSDSDTAWAVGNFDLNQRSISIEVVSDGRDFTDAEVRELRWLVQMLMQKYHVPAEHVLRHYDAVDVARQGRTLDAHKRCPAAYIDAGKWGNLKNRILGDDCDMEPHQVWEYTHNGSQNCFSKLHSLPTAAQVWEYTYDGSQNCFSALFGIVEQVDVLTKMVEKLMGRLEGIERRLDSR